MIDAGITGRARLHPWWSCLLLVVGACVWFPADAKARTHDLRREIWPGALLKIPADAELERQLRPNPRARNYSVCFVSHPSFTREGLFVERNRWTPKIARGTTLQKLAKQYRKNMRNMKATVRVRGSFLTIDYRLPRSGERGLFVGTIQAQTPSRGAALINAIVVAKPREWNSHAGRRTRAAVKSLSLRR
jgi:hypothetical protein